MVSHALEQEIDIEDDGGGGIGVGGGGGGMYYPGGSGSAGGSSNSGGGAVSNVPIQVACLSDSGEIRNGNPEEVCKAVLPKCSELKKKLETRMKDMLSQKIWGYYNGKDVDLNRSTPSNMVGTDMAYSVCSVVGQNIRGGGTGELMQQAIGKRAECGLLPRVEGEKKKFYLHYDGQNGTRWIAYMLGAYPWLIRKNAYEVMQSLQNDLGNLDSVLSASKAMNQDFAKVNQQMRDYGKSLSAEAKTICQKKDSNLIADCLSGALSVNDPAQRACTIVKAQLASNEGALPNMLAFEVMQRVQKEYDKMFSSIITLKSPAIKELADECDNTGKFLRSKKKKIALTASCFFGGEYCYSGKCGTKTARMSLTTGKAGAMIMNGSGTRNVGFAAVIEKLIRHDICGQNRVSDASPKCEYDIPSKPANAP